MRLYSASIGSILQTSFVRGTLPLCVVSVKALSNNNYNGSNDSNDSNDNNDCDDSNDNSHPNETTLS